MSGGSHNPRARRMSQKKAHLDAVRNDINVTPLVDVMLVLLIIFMLMTLLMGRGHDVNLPKASNFSSEKDKSQPVVTIDLNGDIYVEKVRIGPVGPTTLKEMNEIVQAAWAAPKNPEGVGRIYVKADMKLPYEKVYPVIEYMNKEMQMQAIDLAVAKPAAKGE